ncbi:MAG: DUF2510 domain-containing protein, partial [Acidimicrobiales bacterium]
MTCEHRAPGWYPDPNDPTRIRHWSGTGWSGRQRLRPAWTVATGDLAVLTERAERADLVATDAGAPEPPTGPAGREGPVLEGPVRPAAWAAMAEGLRSTPRRPGREPPDSGSRSRAHAGAAGFPAVRSWS